MTSAGFEGDLRRLENVRASEGIPATQAQILTGIKSVKSAVTLKKRPSTSPAAPPSELDGLGNCQRVLNNTVGTLDSYGRPTSALWCKLLHERCPRKERGEANTYGQDGKCLEELGCKGPVTRCSCSR